MSLSELFSAGRIDRELIGATLVIADAQTAANAEPFLALLETAYGRLALGVVGEDAYQGPRAYLELPTRYGADIKRVRKLKPARVIVIGAAAQCHELVHDIPADKVWLNARDDAVAQAGCKLITVADEAAHRLLPDAALTGDPLCLLDALPEYAPDTSLCERFQEYRERNYPVFYAAATGEGEERVAYAVLFELLRQQTCIMIVAPKDPERYEPVYRDAIKYSMPTIRHTRLYTSFVPRKNRVYFVEDPAPLDSLYACADFVIPGGTLADEAAHAPDLVTPILAGSPVIVGRRRDDALLAAAVAAGVVLTGEDVDAIAEQAARLGVDAALRETQAKQARQWLDSQAGAGQRVVDLLKAL
jgi:3-deoxy-D-manno-octulosonic-acid transferase